MNVWNLEFELVPGSIEMSSPIELSESEVIYGVSQVAAVGHHFKVGPAWGGFDVHVDSRCLLQDQNDLRVIAIYLIWERFHYAFLPLARKKLGFLGLPGSFASWWLGKPLHDSGGGFLQHLQRSWLNSSYANQTLESWMNSNFESVFARNSFFNVVPPVGSGLTSKQWHDKIGWRDLAVNICHLYNVKCCRNCFKNEAPKFGGIEFREFFAVFRENALVDAVTLQLMLAIAERTIQKICSVAKEDLKLVLSPLMELGDSHRSDEDLDQFLDFIKIPRWYFDSAIHIG